MEFVSEGSLDLTGYHPEELIESRKISYGALINPEDQEAVWSEVQAALLEDRPFRITYRINSSAGEKWVWERGQGILNPEGKVIALEGFITDITERVTAQQDLEKRVDERTRELSTLLDISHNLASTLELEPLLDLILDQLGVTNKCSMMIVLIIMTCQVNVKPHQCHHVNVMNVMRGHVKSLTCHVVIDFLICHSYDLSLHGQYN